MRLFFWTTACLVQLTTGAQLAGDEGLRKACEQMDGHYKPRHPQNADAPEGDVCQMKFRTGTRNKQEAEELCSLYAPWRLQYAEHGLPTICNVEATLMCEPGWIQMFGVCFRMPDKKKMKTRAEAEAECSSITINEGKIKGKIAYLHHKYIVGVWKNYFRGVRRVWVDASEAYDHVIQLGKDTDGSLALAFNGITSDFTVQHKSLVKVPEDSRMQVLCEYQPEMTTAEINYKAKRYHDVTSPIHPMVGGFAVRTTNYHHYNDGDLISLCVGPLKAFDMVPTVHFVPILLTAGPILEKETSSSFTFNGVFHNAKSWDDGSECRIRDNVKIGDMLKQISGVFKTTCDNMQLQMFVHRRDGLSFELAPAALAAPVWCRVGRGTQFTFRRPAIYTYTHIRASGKGYAYMVFDNTLPYSAAEFSCRYYGGHIAGADSLDELKDMIGYFKSTGHTSGNAYIGAKLKPECGNVDWFDSDRKNPCSRSNAFKWNHGAGENGFREEWWATDYGAPLNSRNNEKKCLALNLDSKGGGVLVADSCYWRLPVMCGIYMERVETN